MDKSQCRRSSEYYASSITKTIFCLGLSLLLRLVLVGLALWLVSGIALNKYRCEYGTRFSRIALYRFNRALS